MMKKKTKLIVASVAMIMGGLSGGQAMASTLSINPAQLLQLPNDQFNITVEAVLDAQYSAGGFEITYDSNVIQLLTTPTFTQEMDPVTTGIKSIGIKSIDPTTNSIEVSFSTCDPKLPIPCTGFGTVGGDAANPKSMTVLDNMTFKVVATNPLTSDISLGLTAVAETWFDANGAKVAVPTMSGATLTVSSVTSVPLPAAAWLMGGGLMGLLGFSRKRREAVAA